MPSVSVVVCWEPWCVTCYLACSLSVAMVYCRFSLPIPEAFSLGVMQCSVCVQFCELVHSHKYIMN